jgi:hypothetical protein
MHGSWNGTLIYLGVDSENTLVHWGEKLTRRGIEWIGFHEPDIGNQLTAIATVADKKIFSNLKLL